MIRLRPLEKHCASLKSIALLLLCLCVLPTPADAVPSFARQTGMACAACHTVFPELTPFGREFKLNGYVLDNIRQVTGIDTANRQTLAINSIPPVSAMLQVSYTHTGKALPDTALPGNLAKDGEVLFPQQLSLFYAGKIADELGAFMQLTYDGAADHFGFDNTDIRYAHHLSFGGPNANDHHVIVGLTLNNNPTVQDVWNTTPAWGFPYSSSSVAPGQIASAQIDGRLGQSVAGLGVYMWLDDHWYAEVTGYTAAVVGGALRSTVRKPMWRMASRLIGGWRTRRDGIEIRCPWGLTGLKPKSILETEPPYKAQPMNTRTSLQMLNINLLAKITWRLFLPPTSTRSKPSTLA